MANDIYNARVQSIPRRWAIGGFAVEAIRLLVTAIAFLRKAYLAPGDDPICDSAACWTVYTGAFAVPSIVIAAIVGGLSGWLCGLLARRSVKRSQLMPDNEAYDAISNLPGWYACIGAALFVLLYLILDVFLALTLGIVPLTSDPSRIWATVGPALVAGALGGSMAGLISRDKLRKLLNRAPVPDQS